MKNFHCVWFMVAIGILVSSCASTKKPGQQNIGSTLPYKLSEEEILKRLSESIQHKTVSHEDTTEINYEIYDDFIDFLESNYPNLHGSAERIRIGGYSLLYKWEGSRADLKPALFMGRYDVVPVSKGADSLW